MQQRCRKRKCERQQGRKQQQRPGRAPLREPRLLKLSLERGFEFTLLNIRVELNRERQVETGWRLKHREVVAADVDYIAAFERCGGFGPAAVDGEAGAPAAGNGERFAGTPDER